MITINPDQIRKILIRGVNWIGDAVLTTPALSAIRKEFPGATIHLLAKRPVAELLGKDPGIDNIMVYDIHGRHQGPLGRIKLIEEIKNESFDMAILLQNAFEAALIAFLSAIPIRYGYNTDGRGSLLNLPVPCTKETLGLHQVYYYLNLVRSISSREYRSEPLLRITAEEEAWADKLLNRSGCIGRPIIGINPGSTYGSAKRWPIERFAMLSDILIEQHSSRVIIFGGPGEKELGAQIAGLMKEAPLDLSGETSIRELMALIKRCDLFITNDSGPMHIAAAFGVPVVAIFGPTDHQTTSPFGDGHMIIRKEIQCAPCLLRECPTEHECMKSIMVDDVLDASEKQIRRKRDEREWERSLSL
ncbi:MAG TPA: lipopolysaccharide heptosyltransferase II [Nitrospiria bacterium]|nr:lipopolysaccharide heptosyltransferase II [Nitrospiria bacterium]